MGRGKPAKPLVVKVPRHGAQRLGAKFGVAVEAFIRKGNAKAGKAKRIRYQHNSDPPSGALAQAIESASEWNSLLMTARAERGPQWDVGTQQFQVDHGSDLYYDPTPLLEALRQQRPSERESTPVRHMSMQPPEFRQESPRITRNPSAASQNYAYGSPRHPQHPQHPHQTSPFTAIPPGHFYGDPRAAGGMVPGSMSPDVRRRPGRMGPEEGFIALHGP
ncbi:hypothetical protein F5I97DRAFT_1938107 [Phlebopus sp. FC_14]|nr:hypothetical protein F5I97DRAFT_1938107 [Phlebopus sp. FC_14]